MTYCDNFASNIKDMPAILEVFNLSKSIGELQLLKDVSFSIQEGDKTGLIASNGAGKTTLLNILAGDEDFDSGTFQYLPGKKVGYLPQEPAFDPDKTVLEAVFDSENSSLQLIKGYEQAINKNDHREVEILSLEIDNHKLWDYESRIRQILSQLGISDFDQKMSALSGGQRKRVAIAAMLLDDPDFIILDEPTNHLDIPAISWLEEYLRRSKATLFMVTHDRYFLDRVCNDIVEIDQYRLFRYKGNYTYFQKKKTERLEQMMSEIGKAENLLRKEQEWMRRMPKARGSKAKYRIDNFYELKEKASQRFDNKQVQIKVGGERLGSKIMVAKDLSFYWGDSCYLNRFSYTFNPYDKIGIIGGNGCGKSTFLDILTHKLSPASGELETGQTIKFGYYRQGGLSFDENDKVLDAIIEIAETVKMADGSIITASQFLNHFLFPPARQHDYIYKLSGGEKRRLYLCSVLMQNPNFLILDEPTNDLDIATLEILEEYLENFAGCVMIVSHDRYFLDELVDHVFVFQGGGEIKDFPGNYSQYIDWSEKQIKSQKQEKIPVEKKESKSKTEGKKKLSYSERLELEELEKIIEDLSAKKIEIESELNASGGAPDKIMELSNEIGLLMSEIEEKELRWLELSEKGEE